jgi:NCAIR mutase (PurE)-related protein
MLEKFKAGELSLEDAALTIRRVEHGGVLDVDYHTKIDTTREARCGFPEVIFGSGKTAQQVADIMGTMAKTGMESVIATRVDGAKVAEVHGLLGNPSESGHVLMHHADANILHFHAPGWTAASPSHDKQLQDQEGVGEKVGDPGDCDKQRQTPSKVAVLAAGTSDLAVAEEAAVLLELTGGVSIERVYDVGVAGIHRLFQKLPSFVDCHVCIVCAGMDGALPSAVGGLLRAPVIAVPTSVGYGAAFSGLAPLLTMLNSCAPGVSVVNIDNGFGAAVMAHKIVQQRTSAR